MENADLTGHAILIVENEISWFVDKLQNAIDATGAQSMVIRGPERSVIDRIRRWKFSAAVLNIEHAPDVGDLDIPLLVYGTTDLPKRPRVILGTLAKLLRGEVLSVAYEYRKIDLGAVPIKVSDIDVLNDAGKDGWELVAIAANYCAYLRRIRPAPKDRAVRTEG